MTLKVWHFDPAQLTPYYNFATCDALAKAGCDVKYIASKFLYDDELPTSERFDTEFVYFCRLNNPHLLDYPRIRRILRAVDYPMSHLRVLRMIDRERPDVMHFQWSRLPIFDLPLIKRIQNMGIPVVHTVHDVIPLFARDGEKDSHKHIYETVDHLIMHTQANVESFHAVYPHISTERIGVIPMLESANHHVPDDATKAKARQYLNLPEDAPILLFFGSIRYYKGVDLLLEAFEQALDEHPDMHLVIAGRADPLERAKLPALDRLAENPNIHLYNKFIPTGDLWAYHMAADVIVYPYRHIYQSAALITGMAFGRAVIVTDVGGMPETIDENGWIVPVGAIDILAKTMLEAVSDPQRLDTMGSKSRQIIETQHNPALVAEKLIEIYRQLIAAKSFPC